MNTENLDARIEEILRKQEEIKQDIERLNTLRKNKQEEDKTHIGWEPRDGEWYYFVRIDGPICQHLNEVSYDESVIKYTRVFKTKEEAEFEAERMKVLRELEKFACEFEYDSESYRGGYSILYDYLLNQLLVFNSGGKRHELYFESREKAKEAIETVGEDRVKKYYLGVQDN